MEVSFLKSLRFRMPLLVLSAIIPVIAVANFYATETASKTMTKEARENLVLQSRLLAENVQNWNESNVLALINLNKELDIIGAEPSKEETILRVIVNTYEHLYLAHTMNLQGWDIARSDGKKSKYYGDRDYFIGAIAGKKINYQTIISRTTKEPALCIATPTLKSRKTVGVTSICTDLKALTKQVGQLQFGNTGYAFLIDENADLLAHPDGQLLSGDNLVNLNGYPPVTNILQGNSGDFFFTDESNVKWVSYSIRLNNGWSLVIQQEETEFLSKKVQFQNLALSIGLVVILAITALTFWLANHLIAPISNLTSAASGIANGQFEGEIKIKREDELGILANSFNQMKEDLKNLFTNLEQLIEQRTAQLKEAKESAEKASVVAVAANQSKDRFLANISHEFRTPLNSIIGYNRLIQKDTTLSPIHSKHLKIVEQSSIHLLSLINDLLDISQIQLEEITLYPHHLKIEIFLNDVLELVALSAREKNLTVKHEYYKLPTLIKIDDKRLRQILINLLNNAIKFTTSGQVTLKVSAVESIETNNSGISQQKLRFSVIDTGVGMDWKDIKKIFQPFEQIGNVKSRAIGTGLGLSIVSELVKLMGGELKVKSKLGIGSVFWFEIMVPVVLKQQEVEPEILTSPITKNKQTRPKILVVDDQKMNRELMVKMLQPRGFKVFTANDGEEMLKIATVVKPDLILLDLFMPVKTGFTCAKELRQDRRFKNTPIIIVTASTITKEMSTYLDCEAVLNKPINEPQLLRIMHQYLSKNPGKNLNQLSNSDRILKA